MKTYQYYSTIFSSEAQSTYNAKGILVCFFVVNNNEIEKVNLESGLLKNYVYEKDFLEAAKKHKLKLTEIARVVTFDQFWDTYKEKNCGRTKCEEKWDKLSKKDQLDAFDFIPTLNSILKDKGTAKPYATTYLNSKRWIR